MAGRRLSDGRMYNVIKRKEFKTMKRFTGILLTISMILSIISANVYAAEGKAFTDITDEAYSEAATALQKLEVLEGYPDGTFKAENSITRAEMAAVICRMRDNVATQFCPVCQRAIERIIRYNTEQK